MSVFRFRVHWEEDDLIYRDVEILSSQTFLELHQAVLKAYDFDSKHAGSFFESNDRWQRTGREMSSEVATNKKDAPALSMARTPVGALVTIPDQHFIYEYDRVKQWAFLLALVGIEREPDPNKAYPWTVRREGIAPQQYGAAGLAAMANERAMETVEAYDATGEDRDAAGFGSEGEGGSEEADEGHADSGGQEDY